ncbi:MAG: helix-turn-helix domain-containing protein [Oscillospiraceae bacterium]|nr:helix-turn-helix domain-containing protein [Oscillospiraceae bacterium]
MNESIEIINSSHDYSVRPMLENQPDVMDVNQMSQVLGVSTKTGYSLLNDGKIAFLKIGRSYRIPKSKLLDYMKSATVRN